MYKDTRYSKNCSFKFFFIFAIFLGILEFVKNVIFSYVETLESFMVVPIVFAEMVLWPTFFILFLVCYIYNTFREWKNINLEWQSVAKFFLGPWMFIPQVLLGTITILSIYQRPMETGIFDRFLFFQGSIDMGGELVFVATIALYVLFGFTASWYAVLKLDELDRKTSFFKMFIHILWVLKYHIIIFLLWGISSEYDNRIVPNDFRNMFLFVSLLYFLTIVLIIIMRKLNVAKSIRLVFAPIFIVFWLYVGSDGNTARANQIPIWGDNPHYVITSKKHAVMIAWHNLCDDFFGDPKPHYTHQYKP